MSDVHYCIADGVEFIELHGSTRAYPAHSHAGSYTIGLVLSGNIKVYINGDYVIHSAGSVFILPPLVQHWIEACDRYDMLTVSIRLPLMEADEFERLINEVIPSYAQCFVEAYGQLPRLQQSAYRDMAQSLYDGNDVQPRGSKYHGIREFKKAAGLPPHKFRIQSMVRQAQRLITDGVGLTEAAQECGFYDQSHFIRHFKYFTGLTPSEYRKVSTKLG